ncbi:MAG: hypothetical protein HOE90_14390 [Bacteriovoracaceae bacterium]|jgi:hypothetical protein|nr:hypothetical protein [Bacteriovoracaceae bacterium]
MKEIFVITILIILGHNLLIQHSQAGELRVESVEVPEAALTHGVEPIAQCPTCEAMSGKSNLPKTAVDHQKFCQDPIPYLCDPTYNPHLDSQQAARAAYIIAKMEIRKDPQYIAYNREKFGVKDCHEIDRMSSKKKFVSCVAYFNTLLKKKLFTPKRVEKASKIHEYAKQSLIAELEKQKAVLQDGLSQSSSKKEKQEVALQIKNLQKMIEIIARQQVNFGRSGDIFAGKELRYNIGTGARREDSEYQVNVPYFEKASDGLTAINLGYHDLAGDHNTTILEGAITLIDFAPSNIYRILLHELSHQIDPSTSIQRELSENYPFSKEVHCLQRKDTTGAKISDISCLKRVKKEYEKDGRMEMAKIISKFIVKAQKNPYGSFYTPPFNPEIHEGIGCQNGQVGETFSDLLGDRAFSNSLGNSGESGSELSRLIDLSPNASPYLNGTPEFSDGDLGISFLENRGTKYIDIGKRLETFPAIGQTITWECEGYQKEISGPISYLRQYDPHLLASQRLRTITTEPNYRKLIGCADVPVKEVHNSIDDPVEPGIVARCSEKLYSPE